MKVLVLGGTGAMGTHLVSILANSGIETVVSSRKKRPSYKNIKYIQGNAHDLIFLKTLLHTQWDAIIDFMVYSTPQFKNRIELLLKSTNQYIYFSSSRVYASNTLPINEDSPRLLDICKDINYLKTDEYALAKARQEDVLKNSVHKNWTIIRPYITFSENRLQLGDLEKENWLYRALHNRTIVFSRDICEKLTTLTYGLDVSKTVFEVIGNKKAMGEIYHITNTASYKWEEILTTYIDVLNKKFDYKQKTLIVENAPFQDKYQVKYDRIFSRKFNNTKISEFINTKDFTSTLPGLAICLEKFLDLPKFLFIDWKKEAYLDRLCGEVTSLSEIKSIKQKIIYLVFRYIVSYRFIYKTQQKIKSYGN
jgi:nucleoside-diphosphate-sugar epimerase